MAIILGLDIQSIDEVQSSLNLFGERYVRRLHTRRECQWAGEHSTLNARTLTEGFATKEAVLKVLQPSGDIPSWRDIELRRTRDGQAAVELSGVAAQLAQRHGITGMHLSLSRSRDNVTAVVIAET